MTFKVKTKGQIEGEELLVPKLRFKEFNSEYKKYKIGDTLKVKSGKDQKSIECINGKYPILGTGGQIGTTNSFLYDKPSVLIGRKGTINKPQYMTTPFWTVDTLFYTDIKEEFNTKYIFYAFQNINWKKYDESTGVPSLSCKTIEEILYYIPNKNEQDKISTFITLLDKKIELQQRKIETLKIYKRGLLHKTFINCYANCKIKDLLILGKSGGTPKSTNTDYYNGNIPFLSISDMTSQGKYIKQTEKHISNLGLKNSSAWLLPVNTLILSMYASYGLLSINKISLATSQAMFNMIFKENINVEYIYYYLSYLKERHFYEELVSTGTQANLNADKVKNIPIYLPNKTEQYQISSLFNILDNKLGLQESNLNNLIILKKSLLQQLFI